jgi:hypothetical protein
VFFLLLCALEKEIPNFFFLNFLIGFFVSFLIFSYLFWEVSLLRERCGGLRRTSSSVVGEEPPDKKGRKQAAQLSRERGGSEEESVLLLCACDLL